VSGTDAVYEGAAVAAASEATAWAATPLQELLLALADDELIIGYWDSEWTGIAPALEEDVAMSSIAQDEIGHALALYTLLAAETNISPDRYAYGRQPADYRCAALLGHARGDWAFTIARRVLYETADAVRLAALEQSSHAELAGLIAKMRREETYHLAHFQTWFRRLADGPAEGRERFAAALAAAWPAALDLFAPLEGEDALIAAGVLPLPLAALREQWEALLLPELERVGVVVSDVIPFVEPRRGGTHPDFAWLWNEMTLVYRSEPGASW
jgi:ring-1,2-phenylacetyl-CoA epoxidase subunit PaaC